MNPTFSVDELLIFHEVVRAGSLTKASQHLHVAKSTVSRRLARLEKELGALLLKRNSRKLAPTEIGLDLYARCERIAHEIEGLGSLVESSRSEVRGTLRVSIPSEFGSGWLAKAIADFTLAHPDLQLEIEISVKPVNLLEEPFDIAIAFGRFTDSRLMCKRVATLARGIYASAGYLQNHRAPRNLEELSDHPFIVTDVQQREGILLLREASSRRRITITHRVNVNSMRLARELVLSGVGLAVLPNSMCARYVGLGQLVPLLPRWKCPSIEVTAVVLAREGIPLKTRSFLNFISERLSDAEVRVGR